MNSQCPLCKLAQGDIKTKLYYQDNVCIVVDCLTCSKPMIVLKHHGEPTEGELQYLQKVSKRFFPDKKWRGTRREILNHWHEHFLPLK